MTQNDPIQQIDQLFDNEDNYASRPRAPRYTNADAYIRFFEEANKTLNQLILFSSIMFVIGLVFIILL